MSRGTTEAAFMVDATVPEAALMTSEVERAAPADVRVSMRLTLAVWKRNRDVMIRLWKWLIIPNVVDTSLSMIALGLGIGSAITGFGGDGYAAWIAPGLAMSAALFSAGFECSYGTYFRMDKQRTFDAMVATPAQIEDVVLGELLYGAFRGMVAATAISVIFAAFGLFDSWWALLLPAIGFLTAYMMSTLAVTAASLSPMLETLGYWVSFGIFPMYWLSGTFYRPDDLSGALQTAQYLSPAYHAVALARDACGTEGASLGASSLINVAVLVGVSVVCTWSAIVLMRRRLIR